MKITQFAQFLVLGGLLSLSSCSKKADDVTPSQQAQSTVGFQAKINGAAYAPDYAYALASFPGTDGYYAVYGLNSKTDDVIVIALPNTAGEGTFPLSSVNVGAVNLNKESYSTTNGGSGTVIITKKTATYMTGTFSFTAVDATGTKKLALTEGTFNVNIR